MTQKNENLIFFEMRSILLVLYESPDRRIKDLEDLHRFKTLRNRLNQLITLGLIEDSIKTTGHITRVYNLTDKGLMATFLLLHLDKVIADDDFSLDSESSVELMKLLGAVQVSGEEELDSVRGWRYAGPKKSDAVDRMVRKSDE